MIPVTVSQEEIVDPLLETHEKVADRPPLPRKRRGQVGGVHGDWMGDTNTGMNVIVAGTPRMRSTKLRGGHTVPEENNPRRGDTRGSPTAGQTRAPHSQ